MSHQESNRAEDEALSLERAEGAMMDRENNRSNAHENNIFNGVVLNQERDSLLGHLFAAEVRQGRENTTGAQQAPFFLSPHQLHGIRHEVIYDPAPAPAPRHLVSPQRLRAVMDAAAQVLGGLDFPEDLLASSNASR